MNKTDGIDFLLTLDPHSWSSCWIVIDCKPIELSITHIFGDPYADFMDALLRLMKGQPLVTFIWHGEPGGCKIEIERKREQRHVLQIRIDEYYEPDEQVGELESIIHFEMKERQFLIQAYYQLKKIEGLLRDRDFAKNRQGDFPFERFKVFESELKEYAANQKGMEWQWI